MLTIRAPGTVVLIAATTCPVSASPHSATTAACAAVPGDASTCASAVGTALIMLPRHGPDVSDSRFGTISMLPPAVSVPKISNTDTSKLSDVDASTRDSSAAGNANLAQDASNAARSCSITTPLGRPVEPEVNMTYAAFCGLAS